MTTQGCILKVRANGIVLIGEMSHLFVFILEACASADAAVTVSTGGS